MKGKTFRPLPQENAFWVLQLRAAWTWEANPWDDKIHELCCLVPYCSCKHSILHSKMLSKVHAVNIEKCQLWNSLSKFQCSSTCILPRAVGDSPIVGAITLPSCPRRTCLIWWTRVFNERWSVIQYLAFLVVQRACLRPYLLSALTKWCSKDKNSFYKLFTALLEYFTDAGLFSVR